ncbi:MAG: hypothetical protein PVG03_15495 [Desulfarculaceae bacterium]
MRRFLWAVLLCGGLAVAGGGLASAAPADPVLLLDQTKELVASGKMQRALVSAGEAVEAIWAKTPYHLDTVTLTQQKSDGYGQYDPKDNNVYPSGKSTIYIYMEPRAYKITQTKPGVFNFGLALDLYLLRPDGKVVFGKENFARLQKNSRRPNREFSVSVTVNLTNAPAGKYLLKLVARDKNSKGRAEARVPIEIK